MSKLRWILALPVALLAAQAVQVRHTNPPVEAELVAPPAVTAVLRRACWDCHSNETVWRWHTWVAPISWLAVRDVNEGRRELNFSAPARRRPERLARKLAEAVGDREMPPALYLLAHPEARLSDADRAVLLEWAAALRAEARRWDD